MLVRFITESYNREECENAIEVIYNMVNCLEVEEIAEEIINAELVECLRGRLAAHQLYSTQHLSIVLEILDSLAD